ncbi:MAG: NTP transferase domain-containing protein [Desulfobacterales bacterium]|nr:NTP transferase domain-containing protein [Desulfobacterales bacterium]
MLIKKGLVGRQRRSALTAVVEKGINMDRDLAVIILAAGLGKRMKSNRAKVLHEVLGKPMVVYVVEAAIPVAGKAVIVVVGNQAEEVKRELECRAEVMFAYQDRQLGTGHAVRCALPHLPSRCEDVMVLCGDVPLITTATLSALVAEHVNSSRDVTLLAVDLDQPYGYGRVLFAPDGLVAGIVEEADATQEQRAIRTINSGIYCINRRFLEDALPRLTNKNAQGEFYLTDIVRIGYESGRNIGAAWALNPNEILGINTPQDLARMEELLKSRAADMA